MRASTIIACLACLALGAHAITCKTAMSTDGTTWLAEIDTDCSTNAALYKGTSCVMLSISVTTDGTEAVTYSKACTPKGGDENSSGCTMPATETTVAGKKVSTVIAGKTTTTAGGFTEDAAAVKKAMDALATSKCFTCKTAASTDGTSWDNTPESDKMCNPEKQLNSCGMAKLTWTDKGTKFVQYSKGCLLKGLESSSSGCKSSITQAGMTTDTAIKTTTAVGGNTEDAAAVKKATDAITNGCSASSASTVAPSMAVAALLSVAALFMW